MTQYHGKALTFKLDGTPGGTLRDISKAVISVDFPRSVDTVDISTADPATNSDHKYLAGMRNATITLNLIWDDDTEANAGVDTILAGSLGGGSAGNTTNSFEFYPNGSSGANKVKYNGECFVTAYNPSAGISDAVKGSATLQCTGPITRTLVTIP